MHRPGTRYDVEAGRCITKDGIPFVAIHPCKDDKIGSANYPYVEADEFTHIAAKAPEMLAELKDIVEFLCLRHGEPPQEAERTNEYHRIITRSRALLREIDG